MKKFTITIFLLFFIAILSFSQTKKKLIVLNMDVQGLKFTPEQMGNLLRIETEKLDTFEVMDRYDVSYLV